MRLGGPPKAVYNRQLGKIRKQKSSKKFHRRDTENTEFPYLQYKHDAQASVQ